MKKVILIIIIVLILGIQFIPVDQTNPPVTADLQAPQNVKEILKRSCYDCHSNETEWPWYGYVAPASWLVSRDVNRGRKNLNFSEWETMNPDDKKKFASEIWEEIDDGEMPLGIYTLIHSNTLLSAADLTVISRWTRSFSETKWP